MPISGHAHHMTAAENLDWLARHDWECLMKDIFKEVAPQFKVLKNNITDYQKVLKKEKKATECEAKATASAEARVLRAQGCGRGTRGGGRRQGRAAQGQAAGVVAGVGDNDMSLSPDNDGGTGSSGSGSDSGSESEVEIPILQLRQPRPVRLIQAHQEAVVAADHHHPAESGEANIEQVSPGNGETTVQGSQPSNKDKLLGIDVSQRVGSVETTVDALDGGRVQQDAIGVNNDGNQRVQPPRQNPRCGKQSDS